MYGDTSVCRNNTYVGSTWDIIFPSFSCFTNLSMNSCIIECMEVGTAKIEAERVINKHSPALGLAVREEKRRKTKK